MARTILRSVLWTAKGLLLALALAAVFLWAWSHRHAGEINAARWTVTPERVDEVALVGACADGRMGVGHASRHYPDERSGYGRHVATRGDRGWRWTRFEGPLYFHGLEGPSAWGPFRWESREFVDKVYTGQWRYVSFPCALLALTAGAWPVTSLTRLTLRRLRARRLLKVGRCRHCGYDLRATPDRCPECGRAG
jgi:hypothetical protein